LSSPIESTIVPAHDGSIDDAERREGTPRSELARIRASREEQSSAVRSRIMAAVLETCGDRGFRTASVQDAIDRCGVSRVQFYRHFGSKADAYAAGYEAEIGALCERVLEAGRAAPGWRPGLRAALCELARYLAERPALARGLLVEVHVAGEPALAKRAAAHERLAAAIDAARREAGEGSPSPPPLTARFMLGAVDSAAAGALVRDDAPGFAATVPELAHMIVAAYFGEAAAAEELAAAGA
jgi:AcrR family transcriptional regulator